MPRESFFVNRLKSVGFAFKGAWLLLKTEPSIQIQFTIACIMTVLGYILGLSNTEWILQTLAIVMVMGTEGMNTAVEKLCDFVHPEFHKTIGLIKDISAGAVMIVSIGASIIGLIIYLPKLF